MDLICRNKITPLESETAFLNTPVDFRRQLRADPNCIGMFVESMILEVKLKDTENETQFMQVLTQLVK
jgi:hypothetical protein